MRPSDAVFLPPRVALPAPRAAGGGVDVPLAFFAAVVARLGAMLGGGDGGGGGETGGGEAGEGYEGLLVVLSVFGALLGMGPLRGVFVEFAIVLFSGSRVGDKGN
ncbi:hypothetical protein KVT40_004697 [Elsinoe batatas]|uniref:Uncharacterized protein n=1 Tax=Elsinoe batatas TaxID=2601811 RepID=A0A8K0L044_9PEZI|nr:hypothetical protein KVT40_004697 [Elsinoe batatas]